MKHRISPSTIIATTALFFSLAGTGLAASHYLITSIHQIKPSVRAQLRGATGPAGAMGPTGPQGAAARVNTNINPTDGTPVTVPAGGTVTATSPVCQTGLVAGGGYNAASGLIVTTSQEDRKQWSVTATNPTAAPLTLTAQVECEEIKAF